MKQDCQKLIMVAYTHLPTRRVVIKKNFNTPEILAETQTEQLLN